MSQIINFENEINLINKEYTFSLDSFSIKYTVKMYMDENENIYISIITKDNLNNDIIYNNKLNFEDLELYDQEFLRSFKKNTELFYKFLLRLFYVKLIYIKKSINDNLFLILVCLHNNNKREISIEFPICKESNEMKNDNKNNNDKKNNKFIKNINKKNNVPNSCNFYCKNNNDKEYLIQISKKEYQLKNYKVYKEIEFKIIDNGDKKKTEYYSYLDIFDFLSISETYYKLFNYSIDNIYEDLIIIFSNNNYELKIDKKCKLSYAIFAIFNEESINYQYPYYMNSIELNKRKRTEEELQIKINKYFDKLEQKKDLDKNNQNGDIIINIEEIKDIKENKLDKSYKKNENNKKIKFSQNFNENCNSNQFFNNLFNSDKKDKKTNQSCFLGHKIKYKNTYIFSYFNPQNGEKSSEKKKDYSKNENNEFKLSNKLKYKVDIKEIYKNYENLYYNHPLDNDNEFKFFNSDNKKYYLCTICNKNYFNTRYKVRKHQWQVHLKPFKQLILKQLTNKNKNK